MRCQDKAPACEGCEMRRCEEAKKRWEAVKMRRVDVATETAKFT